MERYIRMNRSVSFALFSIWIFLSVPVRAEFSEGRELSSQHLILPEMEQFWLGARFFLEKDKKTAAWKSFQSFIANYPGSPLNADAQFMVAESIFAQAVKELESGDPPDESAWQREQKGKLKTLGRGFKKSVNGFKNLGAAISGEPLPTVEPDRIHSASFSEAIEQYRIVMEKHKKSGLVDTALFRIAECYYNMGDYPSALKHFQQLQKQFPQSYLVGESILGSAQCYLPGGDFGSAELEVKKVLANYPSYEDQGQIQFILGMVRFQEGKYEEALKHLDQTKTADSLFYAGQCLIKMDKFFLAVAKFKKLTETFKESYFAELSSYLIGDSFFLSKNYSGAIQELKKFLNLYPQSSLAEGALYKIAASHFLNKDYSSARSGFNLLLNTYPTGEFSSLARYFIAESYRFVAQLKEASFSYGQLITQMPDAPISANARFKLGWITYFQQNYIGAADTLQKFIDWHPFHPLVSQAYFLMGNCYVKLKREEDAAMAYQQTFDRAPRTDLAESAMALLNRSRYLQGNYEQLTSAYTYIVKSLLPSDSKWRAVSQLYLADSYYRQKLHQEAISIFKSVMSLYPNQPAAFQALDGLSWCYFQLGDYDQSQKVREDIKRVRLPEGISAPTMTTGTYEIANALFNQKKYMAALENYEKLIRESPNSKDVPEAMYQIGLCYYRQEYYSQAIETWQDLENKHPTHPRAEEAAFQVADTFFRAQKYDQAVETYRKNLARYPNNPNLMDATLRVAQAYFNAGDNENAVKEFDAFLRKFPNDAKSIEVLDFLEASLDRRESANSSNGEPQKEKWTAVLNGLVTSFPNGALAAECQFRIARKLFGWKEYEKAALAFEKVIVNYPESSHVSESQFFAGESYYNSKKFEDGISAFKRFLQNFPNSDLAPTCWFHLGTSYFNMQNYEEAIQSYQNLILQFSDSEFASAGFYNLALSQKKLQKLSEAADSYMKLAQNYPKDPNVNFALLEIAKIKKELYQYEESITVLKELDAKIPRGDEQKLEIACLIAESYIARNEFEEAIRSLRSVGSMDPQNSSWKLEALRVLGDIYERQEKWSDAVAVYEEGAKINANFKARAKYLRETYLGGNASEPTPLPKNPEPKVKESRKGSKK